jgi:hypothetical protein
MTLDKNHPVRAVAIQDYRPFIASVNDAVIAGLPRPNDLQRMGSTLEGTVLHGRPEAYVPYFIVMDVLNYQFWDIDAEGSFVRYGHNGAVGAMAMQAAMRQLWETALDGALEQGLSLRAQVERVVAVLRHRIETEGVGFFLGDIPAAESRCALLLEALDVEKLVAISEFLVARVKGTGELGWADAQMLAYLFPQCYADRYLKKAQLTLMFIAGESWSWDVPCRLNVTAAADYQLPKVLRSLNILNYSADLAESIRTRRRIKKDSVEERAIRAATIIACDRLAEHFGVTIEEIDFWLWVNRNVDREALFHLTETTDY